MCEIETSETYEKGRPKRGGLSDPRMGTMDRAMKCETDGMSSTDTPGYFGHLELAKPVYHHGFIKNVVSVLRCVGFSSSKLMIDKVRGAPAPIFPPPAAKTCPFAIRHFRDAPRGGDRPIARARDVPRPAAVSPDRVEPFESDVTPPPRPHLRPRPAARPEAHPTAPTPFFFLLSAPQNEDPRFAQIMRVKNPKQRLRKFTDACKTKTVCPSSGTPQPQYRLEGMKITAEFKQRGEEDYLPEGGERKLVITAEKALSILKNISDEDCRILGLDPQHAHPSWFILSVMPVPPHPVRPSVAFDASTRSEDDLTVKLMEIVRTNKNLERQEQNGAPQHVIGEFTELLQYHIMTFMDNTVAGMPRALTRSGRPIKSISERLKGKAGRIRGNLMGKRVDFSARTVITPDPNLMLDELGVPWSIALNMTYPETVTPYNIERLRKLVENGPHPPPGETGAKYIIREDGQRMDLRFLKKESEKRLEYGYRVERHMINGDCVLFNRQPSLHKMSIMGHRVRIMPYSTFRMNISVTPPYNADFDGDEMNMHLPQSMETRAEVQELMMVPKMIVSPQANKPVMAIVQDTLLACRLITKRDTFITKDVFMNILMWLENWDGKVPKPAILKPEPLWTGKQVFTMFVPDVSLIRTSAWAKDNDDGDFSVEDTGVRIERGELITGILCKKTMGSGGGGLIHVIWEEWGPTAARGFVSQVQWLLNYWLLHHGFTVGISDTIADDATMHSINETITKAKNDVKDVIRLAQKGELEMQPGMTMQQSFEQKVNQILNKARDNAGNSAQASLDDTNNVKMTVQAGSKGSFLNISQMIACVGQQNVEGKRIPFGFNGRSLPHFAKDDFGPESRGFVENSYLRGLTPQEFFFHAMGGREGLIDTAVKTSETGYIQRRLVKAMEDIIVKYDGTVRNSAGDVIQFLYGEDGMDATYVESQKIDTLRHSKDKFKNTFYLDPDEPSFGKGWMSEAQANDLANSVEKRALLDSEWEQVCADREELRKVMTTGDPSVHLPVNLKRIIWNAQKNYGLVKDMSAPGRERDELQAVNVIESVRSLLNGLVVVPGKDGLSLEAQKNSTILFFALVRSTLSAKRVMKEFKLSPAAFNWVIGEVESRFKMALAPPGDGIGTVAAQSIGEPATQMTLNTFHFAGVSAKNVTLGVPRLKEIINIAKKIKTPSLTIALRKDLAGDRAMAKNVQATLEYTTLHSVAAMSEVHYDPDPTDTVIEEDREFVRSYYEMPDEEVDPARMSPWVLRIELNREMMVDKKLLMADIAEKINEDFQDDLSCIFNDDNSEKLLLRIRIMNTELEKDMGEQETEDEVFLKRLEAQLLNNLKLRGIADIRKVFIREANTLGLDPVTETFTKRSEWMLDTEGVNLLEVMNHEDVDFTRTTSNHLIEVIQVLGIEAVRNALLKELRGVIEFDGSYVNYRHLAILVEVMTYRGHLMSITRHGINRVETGPLMRCSFEETVDILMEAAAFAERDRMSGLSENIMLGQFCPLGTGEFGLHLNEEMLKEAVDLTSASPRISARASPRDAAPPRDARRVPCRRRSSSRRRRRAVALRRLHAVLPVRRRGRRRDGHQSGVQSHQSRVFAHVSGVFAHVAGVFAHVAGVFADEPGVQPDVSGVFAHEPRVLAHEPRVLADISGVFADEPRVQPDEPGVQPDVSGVFADISGVFAHLSGVLAHFPGVLAHLSGVLADEPSAYSPTSPAYSPTSPAYSPTSPAYSPTSPRYSPGDGDDEDDTQN